MEELITCLAELEKLKTVERGLNVGSRKENTADGFTEELTRNKHTPHDSEFGLTMDLFEVLIGKLRQQGKL